MADFDFSQVSKFEQAEVSPGFLLWRVSTLWRRAIESVLKPLDLTHPQFVILAAVAWLTRGKSKTSQVAIGRHAGLDPNTTSQILRSLQQKKLIERKRDSDDRVKCPTVTEKGAKILAEALLAVESKDAEFFSGVDLTQVTALSALQKLAGV